MVFLALTRAGYEDLVAHLGQSPQLLWLGAGVLSVAEISLLRKAGCNVTDFTYAIDTQDASAILAAVSTVQEHHPGQRVWVEHAPNLSQETPPK